MGSFELSDIQYTWIG